MVLGHERCDDAKLALFQLALTNGAEAFAELPESDLAQWIAKYDYVVAFFPELPAGFGAMFIHGMDTFRAVATGEAERKFLRSNAIPCSCREDARKLLAHFGDPAWETQNETPAVAN